MIVRRVLSGTEFASLIEPLVRRDPVGHSILAVSVGRVLRGEVSSPDVVWWVAEDQSGKIVAAGQHLVPYPAGLHGVPDEVADHLAEPLADLLLRLGRAPVGAGGPTPAVRRFARAWCSRRGCRTEVHRELGRWVLGRLKPPSGVPGRARRPRADEVDLVQRWVVEFHHEAGSSAVPPPEWAQLRLAEGSLLLWVVHDEPVAMASRTAVEVGVARVGPVWTAADKRGRGYGSAITAAATQAALDDGAQGVCLYTDLANPVSNAIYARLGYRKVGEEIELEFIPHIDDTLS